MQMTLSNPRPVRRALLLTGASVLAAFPLMFIADGSTQVAAAMAGAWAALMASVLLPALPADWSDTRRALVSIAFGALTVAVAAAAIYLALLIAIVAACEFGTCPFS